jgi:hypothetical protein
MSQERPIQKRRNMKVLASAVICIILAAGLVGLAAVYLSTQSQLSEKDNTIASLNLQLSQMPNSTTYLVQIAYLNQQLADLNDSLTSANADFATINSEYANLLQIAQMRSSGVMYDSSFTQDPNTVTILYNDAVDYGGFVVVQAAANATSTYAQVKYTFGNFNFDYNQTLGVSGTAAFPILPTDTVQIVIGNLDQADSNTVTATATYYY